MSYVYRGKIHDLTKPLEPLPEPSRTVSTPGPKPKPFDPSKCGTRAGFKQHGRHDEDPCAPCEDADRAYMDAYNERRKAARRPRALQPCGTHAAYTRHLNHGEKPDAECTEAHRVYQAKNRRGADGRLRLIVAPLDPAKCGTYAGYKAHTSRGQKACPPCSAARVEYNEARKAAQPERRAA